MLSTELETQKKRNDRDNDALKIKAKIVDDQTETIRKLKEVPLQMLKYSLFTMKIVWYIYLSCLFF